jgi:glycosyltransferase involved in cell wall biosynthesis
MRRAVLHQPISESSFVIVANGTGDGPAQALRDYLVAAGAKRVTTVFHPLTAEDAGVHELGTWRQGRLVRRRRLRLPSRPPLTYPLDLVVPPVPPAGDVWFGFNGLSCAHGLAARRLGRARQVVYWCVDYVDERFGSGGMTRIYEAVDRLCCRRADVRFELSEAARAARDRRHAGSGPLAPSHVVPMGAWLDRVPTTTSAGFERRRVVYLGHLVERQGVGTLLEALRRLRLRDVPVTADVIGRGPLERELRMQAAAAGLEDVVTFHGFVADHRDVEHLLADASVAVAPYRDEPGSFTRYADPGKLKAYLAAGLPIVTTGVSPNADELADAGAAVVVPDDPEALADALGKLLADVTQWRRAREGALAEARRYDWGLILPGALAQLGLS